MAFRYVLLSFGLLQLMYAQLDAQYQDSLFSLYEGELFLWRTMTASQAEPLMVNWTYSTQLWAKSKYDSILIILDVHENENVIPKEFQLFQNYPNPFNTRTVIPFYFPISTQASFTLYDLTGEKIMHKNLGFLKQGKQELSIDMKSISTKGLSGGIYFYRINSREFSRTKKMIYLP